MFSVDQKRQISEKVQTILWEMKHPELPEDEIQFHLFVSGVGPRSWAYILNNGAVPIPDINPHNEAIAEKTNSPNNKTNGDCNGEIETRTSG